MSDEVDCGQIRLILLPDYWQSDPVRQILENSYSAGLIQEFVWKIYILYRDLTIYSDKSTNSESGILYWMTQEEHGMDLKSELKKEKSFLG